MNVGDYVRFDYHRASIPIQIVRIEDIFYDEEEKYYIYRTDVGAVITDENIIGKPSSNPIDLIEDGDVIKFIYRGEEYISKVTKHGEFCMVSITPHWEASINAVEIKSIVTKEQFESMNYEVGDDNDN